MNSFEQCRRDCGLSRAAVSQAMSLDLSTISKWESGIAYPTAPRLVELSRLYGCTVDALLRSISGDNASRDREKKNRRDHDV